MCWGIGRSKVKTKGKLHDRLWKVAEAKEAEEKEERQEPKESVI